MTRNAYAENRSFGREAAAPTVDKFFEQGAEAYRTGKDIFTYSPRLNHHEAGAYMDGWIAEKKKT